MKSLRNAFVLLAAILTTSISSRGQIYNEIGDAGQEPVSAQTTGAASGNPLNQILGSLFSPADADLYVIELTVPTTFSATTTTGGLTTLDTALFLFTSGGLGIYTNDDANGTSLQSTLPAGSSFTMSLAPGTYILGISLSGNEPINLNAQLLFAGYINGDSTSVRGPAGGLNPASLLTFNGNTAFSEMGTYRIDLTSAATSSEVVPEPSALAFGFFGLLLLGCVMRKCRVFARSAAALVVCSGLIAPGLFAKPVPENLGYGLDKLVESNLMLQKAATRQGVGPVLYNGYATEAAAQYAEAAIKAEDGRFMVDIVLNGRMSFEETRQALEAALPSLEITAVDANYRKGIIEGWLSLDDAPALGQHKGVRSVFLALKPHLNGSRIEGGAASQGAEPDRIRPETNLGMLGTKFLQGVTQHRVDKINQFYDPAAPVNYNGEGITVGVLSDSFDTRGSGSSATSNMNNFDLPGHPSNPINTTPVVILQDLPGNSDEGRGMAEIVYKMAPRAKIGFATAFTGEVGFANNIRALSGRFPGVPNTLPDFLADVIVDDVSYGGEPIFTDGGVIAQGVDDVAAVGVSYFSSASNSFGVSAYNSVLRIIPNGIGLTAAAGNTALVNTNIDLTGVPTELYQGGFHNFNPNGQDVACLWNVASAASGGAGTEMQWDDPYDGNPPPINQPPIFSSEGIVGATPVDFTGINLMASPQQYVIFVTAKPDEPTDAVVSIIRESDSKVIVRQDTGLDEVVTFFPPTAGLYTIRVERFNASSGGAFTITIHTGNGIASMTTDLNLLVFRADTGSYLMSSSLTTNNFSNNRPVELGGVGAPTGQAQVQFVIARANVPTAPRPATRVRCDTGSNGSSPNAPAEYFDYNGSITGGHNTAAGANGVAAYSVFRPNVPQNFTSAGPNIVYFDRAGNLRPTPEIRLTPRFAAANGANSTWLTGDSVNDIDTGDGQFSGTSAAAPHAAAIAALVLQRRGGPGSVTPAQMTSLLQRSTFPHDLDPYVATGVARASNGGKVTLTIRSDNTAQQARGRNDPNSFTIQYIGPSALTSFVFNPNGLNTEGGGVTSGQNGVDAMNNYFSNVTPGLYFALTGTGGFAFTQGMHIGLTAADVAVPVIDLPAPLPAPAVNGRRLTLSFLNNNFTGGDAFRFTIGRGLERGPDVTTVGGTATTNYNADTFGGGVLIPEGTVIPDGMRFSGTLSDGATFDGRIRNRIGFGYSNLDGFGFLNAEAAISTPVQ